MRHSLTDLRPTETSNGNDQTSDRWDNTSLRPKEGWVRSTLFTTAATIRTTDDHQYHRRISTEEAAARVANGGEPKIKGEFLFRSHSLFVVRTEVEDEVWAWAEIV